MFVESNGKLVISFKTNDYENISKQIIILQSFPDIIKKVSINEASKIDRQDSTSNIDFKLLLEVDNKLLLKNE